MLDRLRPPKGAVKKRKRIGRGNASGWGRNAGKGEKGQRARAGVSIKPGFEGGQMPIHRRMPKRGFHNKFRVVSRIVNIDTLAGAFKDGEVVDATSLVDRGIIKGGGSPVKVLGNGELTIALTVRADLFSKSATEKITAAGGRAEVV